jgi:small GTP-binding protein
MSAAEPPGKLRFFKVILLGETNVGKTTFFHFITHKGDPTTNSVYCDDADCVVLTDQSQEVPIHLWDTAGQEQYHSLINMYATDADGAFIMYDVTSLDSFQKSVDFWLEWIKEEHAHIILFGNKTDLPDHKVNEAAAREMADSHHITYMEGSAKNGEGVQEAIKEMANLLMTRERPDLPRLAQINRSIDQDLQAEGKCC